MEVSGTLSSNLPNDVSASWSRLKINSNINARVSVGGTVIGQQVVAVGGCTSATPTDAVVGGTCAVQDTQVIDTSTGDVNNIAPCIAPRVDPAVVPNMCQSSSNFARQAFVLFGTFNSSLWDDGGGLEKGEVVSSRSTSRTCERTLSICSPGRLGRRNKRMGANTPCRRSWLRRQGHLSRSTPRCCRAIVELCPGRER